jgi:hypothetical protein
MDGACSMNAGDEIYMYNLKGRDHSEDLGVDGG